ncbi:hypothetical protein OHA70_08255 [Kribbella sp. NBC_00382]|uniref:hypothetical protein n=1 Tax=Kribbella sp. NBC_00382 TaxID=2975967 RepID=UPI002E22BFAF
MPRRVAVVVAVPVGVYAVLFLVSVLGGPRIGAPLIPLPGGGGPEAAEPVAGPMRSGEPGQPLPPVPVGQTPPVSPRETELPCLPGPDQACRAAKPPVGGPTKAPTDGSPEEPRATAGPTSGPTGGTRHPLKPVPSVAERPLPSMPPATKTPPRPPATQPPGTPGTPGIPSTPGQPPVTPSGPPERPRPTTIAEALVALLETLRP